MNAPLHGAIHYALTKFSNIWRLRHWQRGECPACGGALTDLLPQAPGSGDDARGCYDCRRVWTYDPFVVGEARVGLSAGRLA